ncbi:DNA polymerase III subunit beta [Acidihalobacter ferrooxydans]|uniref:Beta sliding clamp n=1 Tax=Acidihalobacter ferrooxydans TaxID=1765967 RepID=A0A1P8UFC0_9GAMM|nr:DNA polymerase III subunit beta [Acidihalobacter ferrooxydans]APZ42508.1 DNA polymerase III subunit beta [Acidihalobacter ferrooxydans]
MQIMIEAADLKSAVQAVAPVIKKSTMPILSSLLLRKSGTETTLTANNLSVAVQSSFVAEGDDLELTIPGEKLQKLVQRIPDSQRVTVRADGDTCTISAGRARFVFETFLAGDFPDPPEHKGGADMVVPTEEFLAALSRVSLAMAENDVRYYLNGVNLVFDKDRLTMVGTNAHRLFVDRVEITSAETVSGILPSQSVGQLIKALSKSDGESNVQMGLTSVRIQSGDILFVSQLVGGTFPNWPAVMQKQAATPIVADRLELVDAIETVAITQSDSPLKAVKMVAEGSTLRISAKGLGATSGMEEVEIDYSGVPIQTMLRTDYLIDALKSAEGEKVSMHLHGGEMPVLVEGARDAFSATIGCVRE